MSELLAKIVSAYGTKPDEQSLEKTRRYLEFLKPAVRPDDLVTYGLALPRTAPQPRSSLLRLLGHNP